MPLGDPYLPQPSPETILEEWKNLYMPKESHPHKQPACAHRSVCTYVDRNTYCFYERKGIHCIHYNAITSRPYPAPTDEQCRICSKATERKAREEVLDAIQAKCNEEINYYIEKHDLDNPDRMGATKAAYRIRDYAESLRNSEQEHPSLSYDERLDLNNPLTKIMWVNESEKHDAVIVNSTREDVYKKLEGACVEYHGVPVVHFSSVEDIFPESFCHGDKEDSKLNFVKRVERDADILKAAIYKEKLEKDPKWLKATGRIQPSEQEQPR